MYIFSCSDTTVLIIETVVRKSTWSMQIMPILCLIEPVAR